MFERIIALVQVLMLPSVRSLLVMCFTILITLVISLSVIFFLDSEKFNSLFQELLPLSISITTATIFLSLIVYLDVDGSKENLFQSKLELSNAKVIIENSKLLSDYKELEESIKIEFLNDFYENVKKEVTEEYIKEIENKIKANDQTQFIDKKIENSLERLKNVNENLTKRGNLNLIIGMFLSILGLIFLGYSIIDFNHNVSIHELLIFIIPRISLVLLIELFAYFFLNLYKKSLDDLKYYQNEITNLEAKYLSLQMAKSINNYKLISSTLEQLMKTERNFILEKDQSTIELEKERLSSDNANNTLKAITDIFKNQK